MKKIICICCCVSLLSCHSRKQSSDVVTSPIQEEISLTTPVPGDEAGLKKLANELAQQYQIVDGHVDLPYRLSIKNFRPTKEFIGIPVDSKQGDFDFVRAKKGGLAIPFMSIYIPASYQKGGAKKYADELIDMINSIIKAHPSKFAPGLSVDQVNNNFKKGLISLPMGMENGAPVENDLANLAYFHQRGIRYITLTHSEDNQICDAAYAKTRTWNGLSPFGRQVVAEMNRVGMMVDVSHITDSSFWQVIRLTKAPVIASHSSCRYFTPGFERNMGDDMISALKSNGGIIMINFGSDFLDGSIQKKNNESRNELENLLKAQNLSPRDSAAKPIIKAFELSHPSLYSDVSRVVDHIEHVIRLAGIDHVGFGSDFDGVGDSLPVGLKDVSAYPNIIYELLRRGHNEEEIAKICSKNLLRVWKQVEQVSRQLKS
ncbi:MAG: dipeptidase [Saprospiraceae bacterium]|nr:dipeptidase [Saprospiraceae bacterium]